MTAGCGHYLTSYGQILTTSEFPRIARLLPNPLK